MIHNSNFLSLFLVGIFFSACAVNKKNEPASNLWMIKLNQLYVFDNKKDTIIKNYSLFDSLKQSLPGSVNTSNPDNNFLPMPGSTFIESLMFYSTKQGTVCTSTQRNLDTLLIRHSFQKKANNPNEIISNIKVDSNRISFQRGVYNSVITYYSGTISNDTLFLFMERKLNDFNIQLMPPDTFRVYTLVRTK